LVQIQPTLTAAIRRAAVNSAVRGRLTATARTVGLKLLRLLGLELSDRAPVSLPGASIVRTMRATEWRARGEANGMSALASSARFA